MKLFLKVFLPICVFSFSCFSKAQERIVTGYVTTMNKIRLIKAEVKVLSTKETVLTDSVGYFKVSCLPNDKIKVNAKGFYSEKVKIDEKSDDVFINLKFKSGIKNFEIAAGYGHIKEEDKVYAISQIRKDDNSKYSNYTNILDFIADSSPSIIVGSQGILIRGSGSLLGSSAALILLDGSEVPMSALSNVAPSDVKNVDVLKGSAAATYGVRGANGVVLITTKRGGDD